MDQNMLGAYGPWAASLVPDAPGQFSLRSGRFSDLETWRRGARSELLARLLSPNTGGTPKAEIQHRIEYDGLEIEHLSWSLPYGPPTEAYLLKPRDAKGKLPGIVALHDHGGNKYFGTRKIMQASDDLHPLMKEHRSYYGGRSWANALAKSGYAVLVHDAFLFGSRRIRLGDLPQVLTKGKREVNPEADEEIKAYNTFAGEHECIVAKSLFSAGTSWPGVFSAEDRRALDYLASRSDVDADRLGCAGLSGGGLRTVFLAGLDDRIKCACCVGMMTTWKDYAIHKSHTHTWMVYVPGLPAILDYPEILGLRAPLPTMVLNDNEDQLFTREGMHRADTILAEVFAKAGAPEHYKCSYYPGEHKFDLEMQSEAFSWFDMWLKG